MKRIIFNARANKYDLLFDNTIKGRDIEHVFKGFIDVANNIKKGIYENHYVIPTGLLLQVFCACERNY